MGWGQTMRERFDSGSAGLPADVRRVLGRERLAGTFFRRVIGRLWARSWRTRSGLVLGVVALALVAGYAYGTSPRDLLQGTTAPGSHEWKSIQGNIEVTFCSYCHLTLSTLSPAAHPTSATDCLNCHAAKKGAHVAAPATMTPTATATRTPFVTRTPDLTPTVVGNLAPTVLPVPLAAMGIPLATDAPVFPTATPVPPTATPALPTPPSTATPTRTPKT